MSTPTTPSSSTHISAPGGLSITVADQRGFAPATKAFQCLVSDAFTRWHGIGYGATPAEAFDDALDALRDSYDSARDAVVRGLTTAFEKRASSS